MELEVRHAKLRPRAFSRRVARSAWRIVKVLLAAFAGIGPAPPPRADPDRPVAALHDVRSGEHGQR